MLSTSGHSSPITNLYGANIFGHHESLSKLPSKSLKKAGKELVESHSKRHELDLVYQHFCFENKVLPMPLLFHQCLNVVLSQVSCVHFIVCRALS